MVRVRLVRLQPPRSWRHWLVDRLALWSLALVLSMTLSAVLAPV